MIPAGPLVECVPNFSEGRDPRVVDSIAAAIEGSGARLFGAEPGAEANRSVFTFAGPPEAVLRATIESARVAYRLIDMRRHEGVHPRMGALDVCPFVPLSGIGMGACVELSRIAARSLAEELGVPVYLYEESATRPERRSLAYLRSGGYEALPEKLSSPEWAPDFGPAAFVPGWGATVVGARPFLIALNVNLSTEDEELAKELAMRVRESGRVARGPGGRPIVGADGKPARVPGRLKSLRAIGWRIEAYGCAQVSMNILDYRACPLHLAVETLREEAGELGLALRGSELVGLVPLEAILAAGRFYSSGGGATESEEGAALIGPAGAESGGPTEARLVRAAVEAMGLESVAPFEAERKIVEYAMAAGAEAPRPGARG